MSQQIPDFEFFAKFYPNLTSATQALGQIYVDAASDIVKEQGTAAETMIEYGTRALQPASSEPAEILNRQMELQAELVRALGASAERILNIAGEANSKAFESWMSLATVNGSAGTEAGTSDA